MYSVQWNGADQLRTKSQSNKIMPYEYINLNSVQDTGFFTQSAPRGGAAPEYPPMRSRWGTRHGQPKSIKVADHSCAQTKLQTQTHNPLCILTSSSHILRGTGDPRTLFIGFLP